MPAAVVKGNIAYIGWSIFEDYANKGELVDRELVLKAIDCLLGDERTVRTTLPDRGVVTVTRQGDRHVVHLLFAHTTVRGKKTEVIEDAVPVTNVPVSLRLPEAPQKVYLAPEETPIPFEWDGTRVTFTTPQVLLHQMVVCE